MNREKGEQQRKREKCHKLKNMTMSNRAQKINNITLRIKKDSPMKK
jgi:hypothetical protein